MNDLFKAANRISHISTHEHLGAFSPIGFLEDAPFTSKVDYYKGTQLEYIPQFKDLLTTPYIMQLIYSLNKDSASNLEDFAALKHILLDIKGSGLYQALNIGLDILYGCSLNDVMDGSSTIDSTNKFLNEYYRQDFFKAAKKTFDIMNVEKVLKPVHVNYLYSLPINTENYNVEKELFVPILRVDDLFGIPKPDGILDWSYLYDVMDIEINCVSDIDVMIDKIFAKIKKLDICAIKQLQAYSRPLLFKRISLKQCETEFNAMKAGKKSSSLRVQDYIMYAICERANEMHLPYQIHTGMANLSYSNPAHLENLILRFRHINFVLLHCYPYIDEASYLARWYGNVFVDTAWLYLNSPEILFDALKKYTGFLPASKIFMSCDATNLEEFAGSLKESREIASTVLLNKVNMGYMDKKYAKNSLEKMFRHNAVNLYFKKEF